MLTPADTALVIVDVQGKLAQIMDEKEALFHHLATMVKGAKVLALPILWVEQLPDKLGPTIPEIADHLAHLHPISKNSFSCYGEPAFVDALAATGCRNVIVMGIEAHICVYQTVRHLLDKGFHVEVIADAVSSRKAHNKVIALEKMQQCGAALTSTEMVLFELQGVAEGERFRHLLSVIK